MSLLMRESIREEHDGVLIDSSFWFCLRLKPPLTASSTVSGISEGEDWKLKESEEETILALESLLNNVRTMDG